MNKNAFYETFRRTTSGSNAGSSSLSPSKLRKNKIAGLMGVTASRPAVRKPSKVQRMMSAMPDDIAKKLFTSGDIVLQPMEYGVLWNSVSPARFITRCIKFLLDYEKDPEAMAKALKKTPTETRYFVTCVLHSITVFDLFSIMDGRSEALAIALEKFDAVKKKNPQPNDKRIYKVLNALQKHRTTAEIPVVSMVVDCAALVPLPMSIFSPQAFMGGQASNSASKLKAPPTKYALENCHEEFPFLFPFLQNLLTITDSGSGATTSAAIYGQLIFKEILKILGTLHHQLRMAPESIESVSVQALALMFMLKQFLTVSPTCDINWINTAIKTVQTFKAWPLPFSKAASDLLDMLETESKAPGTYLRQRLMVEDPELLPSSHVASPDDVHVLQVHVMVDREDPLSNTHQALFETVQQELGRKSSGGMLQIHEEDELAEDGAEAPEPDTMLDLTPEHLRMTLVTHIISCDFNLSTSPHPRLDDPLNLVSRSPEEMLRFYERALDIHSQALDLPTSDPTIHKSEVGVVGGVCKLYRESLVNELLEEIEPGHSYLPNRSFDEESSRASVDRRGTSAMQINSSRGIPSMQSQQNLDDVEEMEVDEPAPVRPQVPAPDAEVARLESFSNRYTPLMPPVQFKFWQCKTNPINKPSNAQKTSSGYLFYKAECEQLTNLVNATVEKAPQGVKPVLKLVLMGSNLVLHKYLCAYSAVYEKTPDLLERVDLRVYVCPEGHNDLGRFLAWTDKWYQRHVFTPFAGAVPLAPQYNISETFPASLLDECEMHQTLPVNLLREMLQHYVRSAEHTESIRVYDVQCWTEQDTTSLRRLSMRESLCDDDYDIFGDNQKSADKKKKEEEEEEKMPVFGLTPNFLVPFITSIEIGILSQVEAYKFNMMKQKEGLKDILCDKEFIKTHGGGEFPNLRLSYRACNLNQKATMETKEIMGEFVSISMSNIPEGIRGFDTSMIGEEEKFGTWSGLTLAVRRNQGKLKDLTDKKTRLTALEAEKFIEHMKSRDSFGIQSSDEEEDPHAAKMLLVGTVTIQVTKPRDSFYILADGALVGPLKKISVGPSTLKHSGVSSKNFEVPIQSFFPVAAFSRQESGGDDEEAG